MHPEALELYAAPFTLSNGKPTSCIVGLIVRGPNVTACMLVLFGPQVIKISPFDSVRYIPNPFGCGPVTNDVMSTSSNN